MRLIVIGVLASVLMHGSAVAQTSQEQARILSGFQASVAEFSGGHRSFDVAAPGARIFTPPVATVFRQIIARTVGALEPFPNAERQELLPVIARALPPLPGALEYRLIGNDLVLRDVNEDLIVAVLRDAVGGVATAKR